MATRTIAPGVIQISLDPLDAVNAYVVGDVLVDAGGKLDAKRILKATKGHALSLHALTHVHPDHQGSSKAVVDALRLPFAAPRGETAQAESGTFEGLTPGSRRSKISAAVFAGPGVPVDRELVEGDEVGGFTVVALPGHTPGQVGYWRERDRVLVAGDAFRNVSYATGRSWPAVPPAYFTVDEAEARRSIEKIRELRPAVLAMGHGRPIVGEAKVQAAIETALAR